MNIEEILRLAVREEIGAAIRPLREQLARISTSTPAPAVSDDDELGLGDAQSVSGYSVDTIRKAIRARQLAATKGAKEWRVRRGDLRAWMHRKPNAGALRPLDISAKADKMLDSIEDGR